MNAFQMTNSVGSGVSLGNIEAFMQHCHVNSFDAANFAKILDVQELEDNDGEDVQDVKAAVAAGLCDIVLSFEAVNAEVKELLKTEGYRCADAHDVVVGEEADLTPAVLNAFCVANGVEPTPEQVAAIFAKLGSQKIDGNLKIDKDVLTKFLRGCWASMAGAPPLLQPYARY